MTSPRDPHDAAEWGDPRNAPMTLRSPDAEDDPDWIAMQRLSADTSFAWLKDEPDIYGNGDFDPLDTPAEPSSATGIALAYAGVIVVGLLIAVGVGMLVRWLR